MKFKDRYQINVNEHKEKKGKFDYLSWTFGVAETQKLDESATWEFGEHTIYPDGSMLVSTTVTAFGKTLPMVLPVMDNKNKAIQNPDAFDINTAYMRCLAKNIAAHGIGLYIYNGDDLPEVDSEPINEAQTYDIQDLIDMTGTDKSKFLKFFKISKLSELPATQYDQAVAMLQKKKAA